MFSGKLGATAFTSYVKSGALVNKKFLDFLIPTFLMSMSMTQTAAALSTMISVGAVGHITTALGLGEKDKAYRISSTVCALALGIGILLTAFLFIFSAKLSALISPALSMTQCCYEYLHVLLFRFPFSISLMVMCDIVRSDGMAKL